MSKASAKRYHSAFRVKCRNQGDNTSDANREPQLNICRISKHKKHVNVIGWATEHASDPILHFIKILFIDVYILISIQWTIHVFFYRFLVIIAHAITFTRFPHLFVHEFRGLETNQKTNVKNDKGQKLRHQFDRILKLLIRSNVRMPHMYPCLGK